MKSLKLLTAALALVISVVISSCQDEEFVKGLSSNSIVANVSIGPIEQPELLTPRSVGSNDMELLQTIVMDEDSLLLQEFVCDNLSSPFDDATGTRSASVKTNTLEANGFGIQAFVDNPSDIKSYDAATASTITDGDHYIKNGKLAYGSSQWDFVDGSGTAVDYKWMDQIYFTFWSYYPKATLEGSTFGTQSDRHKMTISDYVVSSSSTSQADLVVAYNNQFADQKEYGTTGAQLSIGFKHILSEIYFDFTDVTTQGYTVDKIEIIGANSKGSCTITGSSASTTTPKTAPDDISWASLSQPSTFTMSLNTATTDTLFMIPQELPSTAKIKITMTKDGKTRTSEKTLSTTWIPGKYYKYQLTYTTPTFDFRLNTASDATTTFTDKNTTSSTPTKKLIRIISQKTKNKTGSTPKDCEWDIMSYKIGSGAEVPVESSETSITVEDLILTEDWTNKQLIVESKKWEGIDKGGHDYWVNKNGISGDNDGTGWSPADWSENKATEDNPIDLSLFDYQNEDTPRSSKKTANCYIIRHAGTYKIPLVYGNGVYTFSGGLTTFKNHLDVNITSQYIENNSNCTAGSATIEWQDRKESTLNDVIPSSSVKLVGTKLTSGYTASNVRYIQFTVSPENIRQTNAVIAVRDNTSSKNIMWSWHIWVTNDPAVTKGSVSVTNYTGNSYGFFPSTALGWIEPKSYEERKDVKIKLVQRASGDTIAVTIKQTKPDKIASSGVMYQWGRKDPFPTTGTPPTSSTKVTLGGAIKAPATFITGSQNWCSSNYTNLWAGKYSGYASTSGTSTASSLTSKTIYDPSPVGYKVPSIYAYSGFSKTGVTFENNAANFNVPSGTTFDIGWNFYTVKSNNATSSTPTIFFAAAGWRDASGLHEGTDGNYHSALIYNNSNQITYWSWNNVTMRLTNTQYQTLGASVRPVEE